MKKGLSLFLLGVFTVGLFVGCGSANSPKATLKAYFEEVKKGSNDELNDILVSTLEEDLGNENQDNPDEITELTNQLQEKMPSMLGEITYKISNESINGDIATVDVSINNYNYSDIFIGFLYNYMSEVLNQSFGQAEASEEELEKLVAEVFTKELDSAKQETRSGKITLKKNNDTWEIQQDDEFIKLMIGESSY